ncbi:fructosamine deglycase FrlB [Arthrobacter pigmenti]
MTISTPSTVEVTPIKDDLATHLRAAVELNEQIDAFVGDAVQRGVDNVYFIGCGGSFLSSFPAHYLLESHAENFATFHMNADEFVRRQPARMGNRSLIVVASHSGQSPDTVEAARTAVAAGAKVLALSEYQDSPLVKAAPSWFLYGNTDAKQVVLSQIAWALLRHSKFDYDWSALRQAYEAWPESLVETLQAAEPKMHEIADQIKDSAVTHVLGGGPNFGVAATLSMCYLQEMQWMDAEAVNAAEFFHGPFEVITDDSTVILFLGEDTSRPIAERTRRFLDKYTSAPVYIDSQDFALPGIPAEQRGHFTSALLFALVSRLAEHVASLRNHSLDARRYMGKVDY